MIKLKNILLEIATGDCYEAAGKLITTMPKDYKLVHGMVNGQGALEGKRFGHAWVESNDTVLDHSNGNKIEIPKQVYYAIGGIKEQDNKYYTTDEALKWILKAKHWGPWEMSGDTIDMYEDIPDQESEIGKENTPVDSKDLIKVKAILKESYQFKQTATDYDEMDDSLLGVTYKFSTPNNNYKVHLYSGEYNPIDMVFDLSFGIDKGALNKIDTFQMTREGNAIEIIKTLAQIIQHFLTNNPDAKRIVISGTDDKRKRVYKALFPKYLPSSIMTKVDII